MSLRGAFCATKQFQRDPKRLQEGAAISCGAGFIPLFYGMNAVPQSDPDNGCL
jgi:hypothetical protein